MTMNHWAYKWPKPNKQGWLLIILYLFNTKKKKKKSKMLEYQYLLRFKSGFACTS